MKSFKMWLVSLLVILPMIAFPQYVNQQPKMTVADMLTADSVNVYIEAIVGGTLTGRKMPLDSLMAFLTATIAMGNDAQSDNIAGTDSLQLTIGNYFGYYNQNATIKFEADTSNTGACYVQVNSLGWKEIKKLNDQSLGNNDIETGQIVLISYDGSNFQMLSPEAN